MNGLRLIIYPKVYHPSEDSYLLLEASKKVKCNRMLELGCGCGLVSIAVARRGAEVISLDISKEACRNTLINAKNNPVKGVVHVVNTDLASALRIGVKFDLIVSNPPYIPVEPSPVEDVSWAAGEDNYLSKKLVESTLPFLSDDGVMLLVQSTLSKLGELKNLLRRKGFSVEEIVSENFFFEKIVVLKITRRLNPE